MTHGIYGQQLTLMEELKAETFTSHARIQTAPFFQALAACQLPLESYVGQLRALSILHGVLEQALASSSEPRVASVWHPDLSKLPLLQQDLAYLEPRAVVDIQEAVDAALDTAESLRLRALEKPLSLLGCLYVLEGSALGALVLQSLYARAFLLSGTAGLSYLGSEGGDELAVRGRWARYRERMNALRPNPAERESITQAANQFFAQLEGIFRALYPFSPESRTFRVTAINPEAGRHPVPTDDREIQAALRAADRCWQRFPYFEQRYGERGRRFARSDAAWLVTLAAYEPKRILQQARWLGRVLAGRGMPTLLLEDQLKILFEELINACPEKKSDYEKLLLAAAALCESRRKHFSDKQIEALAEAFDQAVGREWHTRLPRTGALLAATVADEREGHENAVESLLAWLTDASRFPEVWVTAVRQTFAQARSQIRRG
ncbi:heme oxygenase (biliverdin-IX-beta and delta-forming) [Gammaproteobacteria bacterium]